MLGAESIRELHAILVGVKVSFLVASCVSEVLVEDSSQAKLTAESSRDLSKKLWVKRVTRKPSKRNSCFEKVGT